jgi:hypothetical protein
MSDDTTSQDAAPDAQQVTVGGASTPATRKAYPGMSPLTAGLTYGGAASTVMGPLGLLVGLGAGIVAKRMRDNYLDQQARVSREFGAENAEIGDEINSQKRVSDPDQVRLLDHARRVANDGWYRLQMGDQSGRDMIQQANVMTQGIMQGNIDSKNREAEAQHGFQRNLIGSAANDYRSQFQQNVEQATNIEQQSMRVLDLANQKDFDPDKPFNKAILAQLLSTGINGMYKDAPDMLDAIGKGTSALSHIPVVGGAASDIADAILTGFKSKQFQITKEDYNRIALNMKQYNTSFTQQKMNQLGVQATGLDSWAKQVGVIPQDYSLKDYVSGKMKDLNFLPPPRVPTVGTKVPSIGTTFVGRAEPAPPPTPGVATLPGQLVPGSLTPAGMQPWGSDSNWIPAPAQKRRPTN